LATYPASITKNFAFLFAISLNNLGGQFFSIPSRLVSGVFSKNVPPSFNVLSKSYFLTKGSFVQVIKSASLSIKYSDVIYEGPNLKCETVAPPSFFES